MDAVSCGTHRQHNVETASELLCSEGLSRHDSSPGDVCQFHFAVLLRAVVQDNEHVIGAIAVPVVQRRNVHLFELTRDEMHKDARRSRVRGRLDVRPYSVFQLVAYRVRNARQQGFVEWVEISLKQFD